MRAVASCLVTFATLHSTTMGMIAMLLTRGVRLFLLASPVFALAFAAFPDMRASAQPLSAHAAKQCPDLLVNVAGGSEIERTVVCEAAGYAIASLEQCAIALRRSINIELNDVVRNPFGGQIFGRLDLQHDLVLLTRLKTVQPLVQDTPYRSFAPTEFFRSMVIHEVVHAVMNQNYRRQPLSRAAWEDPAYAIQLESLAAETRESFLLTRSTSASVEDLPFNDIILGFDPYLFAARAYHHLASPRSRCATLQELLNGDPEFIVVIE